MMKTMGLKRRPAGISWIAVARIVVFVMITAAPVVLACTSLVLSAAVQASDGVESLQQPLSPLQMLRPLIGWAASLLGLLVVVGLWWWLKPHQAPAPQAPSPQPPPVTSKNGLLWAVFVLMIALGVPLLDVAQGPKNDVDLVVNCTASQWQWQFEYQRYQQQPISGLAFVSALQTPAHVDSDALAALLFSAATPSTKADELLEVDYPLVLPAGGRVRFTITSEDSIHAWWIPALDVKKEAIPGFVQTLDVTLPNAPGVYRGMCSQLCGQEHAFMPIVVKLVPVSEFDVWLKQTPTQLAAKQQRLQPAQLSKPELLRLGESVYRERCILCHGETGKGASARIPSLLASQPLAGPPQELLQLLITGRNIMPGMHKILARDEIAALASYLRLTWSDLPEAQAIVQPVDVPASF